MAAASTPVSSKSAERAVLESWFVTSLAIAMLAVSTAGFLPSIVHAEGRRAPLTPLVAAHGIVFFAWLLIFLVQGRLVSTGHVALLRRVGVAACFVAAVMLFLGYAACISMARRGFDLSGDLHIDQDPFVGVLFPLTDLLLFAALFTAAIFYRCRPEIHKRLMLFANVTLMGAPLAHFIGHTPRLASMPAAIIMVPISLFLIALVARDYFLASKIHPLTLSLAIGLFLSGPLRAGVIGPSAAWHRLVAWLVR